MTPIKGIPKALNQPFFVGLLTLSSRQWTPCSQRRSPVDPFQQHRQLRRADRQLAIRNRRPDKAPALKALGEQARALAVPPDHLDQIAATTAKDKQMTGIRVFAKNLLGQR